jgi:nitrogen-specific signal transduction histidine kinase
MNIAPHGIWRYAVLIILLLMIAGIAARETIDSISSLVAEAHEGRMISPGYQYRIVVLPILALTMGLLFLAGALGVWAIRSTAQIEGRRRIGRFVDAMDYLRDGVLAVDLKSRVTGMNPAARAFAATDADDNSTLGTLFPCLGVRELNALMDHHWPREVEGVLRTGDDVHALRFRSQPMEDMSLILISDITGQRSDEMRARQVARLQLIGRIARGVAHDFNNILCAISGYASLLERQKALSGSNADSLTGLIREAQRGAAVADQLLDLSRTGVQGMPCQNLAERVEKAANLLKIGLAAEWQVIRDVEGSFGLIALTDAQVEQVIVNLGLLAADEQGAPGLLHIRMRVDEKATARERPGEIAGVAVISAYGAEEKGITNVAVTGTLTTAEEAGVVESVVRSVLEEVGGRLEVLRSGERKHIYRVYFPRFVDSGKRMSALAGVSEEIRTRIAGWHVLLAVTPRESRARVEQYLEDLGLGVEIAADIVSALQHVEAGTVLRGMVFERSLLGEEGFALVKAIRKLRPRAGLVVLTDSPQDVPAELKTTAVFETVNASPETILHALLRAEELTAGGRMVG